MKLINLYGGPGTGKSTTAATLFSKLKWQGVNCELVTEYAKDVVWEESYKKLENQIYIFGKQLHRIWRVKDKVDVVVTDSPIILSLVYGQDQSETFKALVLEEFRKFDSINIFLQRHKPYVQSGRTQTESKAKEIDVIIRTILSDKKIDHMTWSAKEDKIDELAKFLLKEIKGE